MNATKDQNNHVRETTAWALSRTFEFLHSPDKCVSVVIDANLPRVVEILLASIKDSPNVAEKVCGALFFLAQGYNNAGSMSSVLSPYFGQLVSALLATADRSDSNNSRLCASAYETLNEIVRCSSIAETLNMIVLLLQEILKRLNQTFEFQITSSEDKEKQSDLQALLCGVVQVILQKFNNCDDKSVILQFADQIMVLFLRVFSCDSSNVHEEAMLAIGALAYATGTDFLKYMPEFHKYLEMGLQNFGAYQVCCVSVGMVVDICRALDDKDDDSSEYQNELRQSIFEAYSGILQGVKISKSELMVPYGASIFHFAELVLRDKSSRDEDLTKAGVALIGDLIDALGPSVKLMLQYSDFHSELLGWCSQSNDKQLRETASWVQGVISHVMAS
ncbi:hypothetical protein ACQ4PT_059666 [Festuca glaucescens]